MKKTLESALRLMYQSDEDEPDDTYDDQEKQLVYSNVMIEYIVSKMDLYICIIDP